MPLKQELPRSSNELLFAVTLFLMGSIDNTEKVWRNDEKPVVIGVWNPCAEDRGCATYKFTSNRNE